MARYKIQFWLNSEKIDELNVADTVAELKQRRSFSAVVRDGIMIVKELKEGKIDLLLSLYPWVKDAILDMFPPPQPPPTDDITDLKRMFQQFMEQQQGRGIPDTRDLNLPLFKAIGGTLPAAPVAKVVDAKPMSADEIADNFMAFLQ